MDALESKSDFELLGYSPLLYYLVSFQLPMGHRNWSAADIIHRTYRGCDELISL